MVGKYEVIRLPLEVLTGGRPTVRVVGKDSFTEEAMRKGRGYPAGSESAQREQKTLDRMGQAGLGFGDLSQGERDKAGK